VGELPPAAGDADLVRVVFRHLLGNAVKYTLPRPERRIRVSGRREGRDVTVRIEDSGVGFNPAYADKLFGVFQRLHGGEEFEGTGIGLAIVKRIVTRHGGRVWAEGLEDAGAAFSFTLPAEGGTDG
jgi:light-regulated signal transduction histidine kinase (bacteriophytochrome)